MQFAGTRCKPYEQFAAWCARVVGSPLAFNWSVAVTLLWLLTGPAFHFSETWQLVMNNIANVAAFPIVFLIQNTINRQNGALQLKINALILSEAGLNRQLLTLEEMSQADLDALKAGFLELARRTSGEGVHLSAEQLFECLINPQCTAETVDQQHLREAGKPNS